jgi:hypothetical protein
MVPSQPKAEDRPSASRGAIGNGEDTKSCVVNSDDAARQAKTEKTMRLRALRLAKEAADRDAVSVKDRKRRPAGRVEDAPAAIE